MCLDRVIVTLSSSIGQNAGICAHTRNNTASQSMLQRVCAAFVLLTLVSAADIDVDGLLLTLGNETHATKVMLIGDSQTRYLFCQLASLFLESCRSRNASQCPPSSPRPEAKLSFAWVSHTWPPMWWLNRNTFPVIMRFVCVEYLSSTVWVRNAMWTFLPQIVVGGRGCWDVIRRIPHHLPSTMATEIRTFVEDVVQLPSVKSLVLFPMWEAQSPANDVTFEHDSPLTACSFKYLQHFVHTAMIEGLMSSKALLAQRGIAYRVTTIPRDVLLRSRPQDGIHFHSRSVALRMASAVFGTGVLSASVEGQTLGGHSDHEYAAAYWNCSGAGQRYYSVLYHRVLQKTLHSLRDLDTSSSNLVTTALQCTDHWLFLYRYLGPLAQWSFLRPPFQSTLEGPVTAVIHALKMRMVECEDFLDKLRRSISENEVTSKNVEVELLQVHRMGTHPTCKATGILYIRLFFARKLHAGNAFEKIPLVVGDEYLAPNCLNEPFGGWP